MSFKPRKKKIRKIQKYSKADFQNISEVDAIEEIKEFLVNSQLDNKDIEKLCLKIGNYNKEAKNKYEEVKKTAKLVADRININNRLEIQKATHESYNEIGGLVVKWKTEIEKAKDALVKESRKLGIDIDTLGKQE